MSKITPEFAQDLLRTNFAPWLQELGLKVEAISTDGCTVRMPLNERLYRDGGTICGQSLMALADTVMVLTLVGVMGELRPLTTVSQTTNLMKPISGEDVIAVGRPQRVGRTMAFGEVSIRGEGAMTAAVEVNSVYALLPNPPSR
jgi:uncharacterized protein (TIGR00369 family)